MDPALVGTALLVGKLWDAVSDPMAGWLSDRTKSRFGRRKVYLYFGAIPLGISFALLWNYPTGLTYALTIAWLMVTFFLYYTFVTITSMPYYAMTPELTRDYDERTNLTTFRMIGGTIGYMAGAAFPPFIAGLFLTDKIGWSMMGIMFGAFAALCLFITAFGVKQRERSWRGRPRNSPHSRRLSRVLKTGPSTS